VQAKESGIHVNCGFRRLAVPVSQKTYVQVRLVRLSWKEGGIDGKVYSCDRPTDLRKVPFRISLVFLYSF
jgi:hypothetical protein